MTTSNVNVVASSLPSIPQPSSEVKTVQNILIEIVSANLVSQDGTLCNSFCLICDVSKSSGNSDDNDKQSQRKLKVLHQSDTIKENNHPIWTVLDGSLYLLQVSNEDLSCSSNGTGAIEFQLYHSSSNISSTGINIIKSSNPFASLSSSRYIGSINLSKNDLLQGDGSRKEFMLQRDQALLQMNKCKRHNTFTVSSSFVTPQDVSYCENLHKEDHGISGTLALRFRIAHPHEVKFMTEKSSHGHSAISTSSSNIGFSGLDNANSNEKVSSDVAKNSMIHKNYVDTNGITQGMKGLTNVSFSKDSLFHNQLLGRALELTHNISSSFDGDRLIKVKPYPNSNDVENTEWLHRDEINYQMLLPSKQWIEAGRGDAGTIYLEILKCDNLVNLDSGHFGDFTDAFVAIIFEDNLMRTDVIENELSPRWLPWTSRAFAFPIKHPASPIYLGVFDKDVLGDHDAVGRVVINVSNFQDNTVYLLDYSLHSNPNKLDKRGTISVRLRVEWNGKTKRMLEKPPRKIFLNVPSAKSFHVVKYLCRGQVDLDKASVDSIKQYLNEIHVHLDNLFYILDDLLTVILWRGSIELYLHYPRKNSIQKSVSWKDGDHMETDSADSNLKVSLWFPVRSIILFQSAISIIEHPRLIPGVLFGFIGFILFTSMIKRVQNPIPWKRCKNILEIADDLFIGKFGKGITINPSDGYDLAQKQDKLEKERIERSKKLTRAVMAFLSRYNAECSSADKYSYISPTFERHTLNFNMFERIMATPIYYVHMLLKSICQSFRKIRNIFTFESSYFSSLMMVGCFSIGIFMIIFPYEWLVLWICRLLVWIFLSPIMKVVDHFFIRKYYPNPSVKTSALEALDHSFDQVFETPRYKDLAREAMIKKEDGLKLKGMREYMFGKYIEEVPFIDSSLYPCIPLPSSSARPFCATNVNKSNTSGYNHHGYEYLPKDQLEWHTFSGQQLHGTMLPHTDLEMTSSEDKVQSLTEPVGAQDVSIDGKEQENVFSVSHDEMCIIKNELKSDYPEDYLSLSDDYIQSVASKPYSKDPNVRRPIEYTTQKLKDLLKWREKYCIPLRYLYSIITGEIQDAPEANLKQAKALAKSLNYSFVYWHGLDKEGRPILWLRTDRMPWYPDCEAQLNAFILVAEAGIKLMPHKVTDFVVVCDTRTPPPPHPQFMINILGALSKGYPDRLHELTSCPVSKVVQIVMSILLPLMPSRLASKINLIGEAETKSKLIGHLQNGVDDIPTFLGGIANHDVFYPKNRLSSSNLTFDFDGMVERLKTSVEAFKSMNNGSNGTSSFN